MGPAADNAGSGSFPDGLSREQLLMFYVTVQQSRNVIMVTTKDGIVEYVNAMFCEVSGYSLEEVVGRHVNELTRLTQSAIEQIQEGVRKDRRAFAIEGRAVDRHGRERQMQTDVYPIRSDDGDITHWVGVSIDITERKEAEEALRHSEARFRSIFEHAPLGMTFAGTDQKFHEVNDAFCDMLGYPREEIVGRKFTDFTHPDDVEADREMVQSILAGEFSQTVREKRYLRKSGEIMWGRLTVCVVRDRQGEPLYGLGMIEDITEQKRMEEALQQSREELEAKVERQLARGNPYKLSFRELTVLHLVAGGAADKEIAATLSISIHTANKHVANILKKMRAGSRTEAAARALQEGLITMDT